MIKYKQQEAGSLDENTDEGSDPASFYKDIWFPDHKKLPEIRTLVEGN